MRMVSLKVFLLLLACLALNISVSAAKEPALVKDGPDGPAIGNVVTFCPKERGVCGQQISYF